MGNFKPSATNYGLLASFGLGIRSNAPIHGIPFVFWLLVGISMWFSLTKVFLKVPNQFHKNLIKLK